MIAIDAALPGSDTAALVSYAPDMVWLIIIPLIILWAFIQHHIVETTGQAPRARSSLRHQRRKARKMGLDFEEVPYTPRERPLEPYKFSRRTNRIFLVLAIVLWAVILLPALFD
jgi:hypothetical protein